METSRVVKIGLWVASPLLSKKDELLASFTDKRYFHTRTLFTLKDFLLKHSEKFNKVILLLTTSRDIFFPNGTVTGIVGMINRSEIDIGVVPITMDNLSKEVVDFSIPYKLHSATFMIHKPEYKPHIFGILYTFSFSVWITLLLAVVAMWLVGYIHMKSKYSLDKILLNVFAVLLRQSSIVRPSSLAEKLFVYSWVLGTMFICLAYDSVFLSFMAFPPVNPIKDLSDLASVVKNGEYHCFTIPKMGLYGLLTTSNQENLRVIAFDILNNNIQYEDAKRDFLYKKGKRNLAIILSEEEIDDFNAGEMFVSKDRFLETMAAMPIRKDFCCKWLIETFVHRMMTSGLYFKYRNDSTFLLRIKILQNILEKYTTKRKITLTDVAFAFIFLLFGFFISFMVLLGEIVTDRIRKKFFFKKMNKRKKIASEV